MSNYKVCLCLRALSRICFKSIRSYKWTSACKKTTVHLNQNNVHTSSGNDRPHTLSQLQSRSLIELSGKDTIDFLQGLVTNDVNQLAEKSPSTQYSMILNVQGRVLYDLFLYNSSSENKTTILIDIDKAGKDEVLKLFKRYRLRKKVDVIDISDGYKVWCQFNSSAIPDTLKPPLTFHDPRVPLFGCRFLSDKSVNETANANVVDEEEYTTWRYRWGIPEGVTDLPPGNCLPLESNLALMNGGIFYYHILGLDLSCAMASTLP
ncbi:hypothetical protein PoB_001224900 [Plakobranchus ocellatus]|uniref:Aminomethyltransferase folate-binding domain-containing protein n=1 Tax=Plakobranchus ocellatus TaxID=259542 RepID=A0AAV3YUN3_9GAST|nr:hypothetical protein PoB_001224900 [Plakobranchus ocellatus]